MTNTDRTGRTDDKRSLSVAARKAVSSGCRRFLRDFGWKTDARNKACFSNTMQRKDIRSSSKKKKENQRQTPQERQTPCLSAKNDFVHSRLATDRVLSARQNSKAIGLYPSGNMVLGFAAADTACNKQRPSRQRTRRFSFYDRSDDDGSPGFGMLQRQMGHRRYVQEHETVSRRTTASNIQRPGSGTSRSIEPVSVFDGVDVVSQAKIQSQDFLGSAVVSGQNRSELCGCFELPASRALAGSN